MVSKSGYRLRRVGRGNGVGELKGGKLRGRGRGRGESVFVSGEFRGVL